MTLRARALFDQFVGRHLNDPVLAGVPIDSQAFSLTCAAADAKIPIAEVVDEVGSLNPALMAARKRMQPGA